MNLWVNGETKTLPASSTVADLLVQVAPGARRVAVELNGEIVPRSRFETQALTEGDRLEIVQAIGGG